MRAAFIFLTTIPIPIAPADEHGYARAASYFPLVGAVVGLCVAALDLVLSQLVPVQVVSVLDLVCLAALSGGLHLDGLADSADGLLMVGDRSQRLAAMADSRSGAFGVAAIVLVLLTEAAALSSVAGPFRVETLVAAGALSRWSMTAVLALFPSAKADGLAASFKRKLSARDLIVATAIAAVVAAILGLGALAAFAVAATIAALCGAFARARIGGVSGDVCGGVGELVFAGELVLASALYR